MHQHLGSWQAKELSSHLQELLFGFDVDVTNGTGYVEVSVRGVNKGAAVTTLLEKATQVMGTVDFVLCIGDDASDEAMFEAVNKLVDPFETEAIVDDASQLSTTDGESLHSDSERGAGAGRQVATLGSLPVLKHVPSGPPVLEHAPSAPMGKSASLLGSMKKRDLGGKTTSGTLGNKSSGNLFGLAGGDELMPTNSSSRRFFTCTVGFKPSAAKFYLDGTDEVSEILASLQSQMRRMSSKG